MNCWSGGSATSRGGLRRSRPPCAAIGLPSRTEGGRTRKGSCRGSAVSRTSRLRSSARPGSAERSTTTPRSDSFRACSSSCATPGSLVSSSCSTRSRRCSGFAGDVRERALNALRQLIDEIDAGRYPGLCLVITGTPAFFDGPQGVQRLPPLAQPTRTRTSRRTRGSTILARFRSACPVSTLDRSARSARRVRDIYADGAGLEPRARAVVDDAYVDRSRARRDRRARRAGRRRAAPVPQEARGRRARPRRPVPRLRPARALRADPVRRRADRGGARARPARRIPTRSSSTCDDRLVDRPASRAQHHIVNTLGWSSCGRCRRRRSGRSSTANTCCCSPRPRAARPRRRSSRCCRGCSTEDWRGLSVLYVCPLRALLNNLEPRLSQLRRARGSLGGPVARRCSQPTRASGSSPIRLMSLLTTPESLEAILISRLVDSQPSAPQRAGRRHRRAPRLRGRRSRLAPAGRLRTRASHRRPRTSTDRPLGDGRQPRRSTRVAGGAAPERDAASSRSRGRSARQS